MSTTNEVRADVSSLSPETLAFATRMFHTARCGDSAQLLAAIDAGLPVDFMNHKGNTLLMLATYAGHFGLIKMLLKRGADPNVLNNLGQSTIGAAVFKGYEEIAQFLVDNGADPNLGSPNAIDLAHMFRRSGMMKLLRVQENDVNY